MFLALFSNCLKDEVLEDGSERTVLSLPPALAPVKAAILPLVKKDGLPEFAEKIFNDLKYDFNVISEEKDSIGKRYRRQDAIGTPFCITVRSRFFTILRGWCPHGCAGSNPVVDTKFTQYKLRLLRK
jgi:glycyl-tRNA synthetase